MSSGNITNKNIFSSLDSISTSLDLLSDRLEKVERICLAGKDSGTAKAENPINLLPGIIERISSAPDFDGVILELIKALPLAMDRSLVFILKDGKYIPLRSRGYDPKPEENPDQVEGEGNLLSTAVNARQILIFKGSTAEQFSFSSGRDKGAGYGILVPFVFGDQVPLVCFGESKNPPDADLAESLISIASLVIKNQHLEAMMKTGAVDSSREKAETAEAAASQYNDEYQGEELEYSDISVEMEEELSRPSEEEDAEEESTISIDYKKTFRSVDDFDTDVISAEDLIRSFNIDINRSIPDLELETEDFLKSPKQEELEEDEPESEEVPEEWAEPGELEIELPVQEPAEELSGQDYEDAEEGLEAAPEEETAGEKSAGQGETLSDDAVVADSDLMELPEEYEEALAFARLLVSEIKLYNEEAVKEGRRNGDLYSRLKEQIDLSREVYENRVSDEVRAEKDFFGEELVRILARGNTKLLDT